MYCIYLVLVVSVLHTTLSLERVEKNLGPVCDLIVVMLDKRHHLSVTLIYKEKSGSQSFSLFLLASSSDHSCLDEAAKNREKDGDPDLSYKSG